MKNKIYLLLIGMLLSVNAGYTMPATVKATMVKFSLAMGGVVLSSILIFAGLSVYNKFRSKFENLSLEEEVLKHPNTKDEAIKFFIRKNKIQ